MKITKPTKIEQGAYIYEASQWPPENGIFNSGLINLGNYAWGLFTLHPVQDPGVVIGYAKLFTSLQQPDEDQLEAAVAKISNVNNVVINVDVKTAASGGITLDVKPNYTTGKYNINATSYLIVDGNKTNSQTHIIETNISMDPPLTVKPDVGPMP